MRKQRAVLLSVLLAVGFTATAQRYVGGDISCLPSNEAKNAVWLDHDGNAISSTFDFFKQQGMNAMRVRLFVAPEKYAGADKDANACQNLEYVKALGKRIKDAGLKLMLDFHYSDTWADPAKQWTPADWSSLTDDELYTKIYDYTKDALTAMVDAGAAPDFIQTGNEISYGMLWGASDAAESTLKKCYINGSAANWARFTTLLKNAGRACREVCPDAKIILHTERAAQTDVLTNFYDQMRTADVDYDIIGLSYYPIWHGTVATLETALNTLEQRYTDKDIMIVEVGYAYSWTVTGDYDPFSTYPATEAGQQQFTHDLVSMLASHQRVKGLFWWWMEYNAYPWATTRMDNWWYAPLFDSNTGRALAAMSELTAFKTTDGIRNPTYSGLADMPERWYTIKGTPVSELSQSGLYVSKGRKVIVR